MKNVISLIIGIAIGATAGYFVAKKQYEKKLGKEIDSIKKTQDDLTRKEVETAVEEALKEQEENDPDANGNGHIDLEKACAEEDEDEDYGEEFDDYRAEREEARQQFLEELDELCRDVDVPYNITEAQYNKPYEGYEKGGIIIDQETDRAYDEETGEEIDFYHDIIGDLDYGTLDEERRDEYGHFYIRCPKVWTDYKVIWSPQMAL